MPGPRRSRVSSPLTTCLPATDDFDEGGKDEWRAQFPLRHRRLPGVDFKVFIARLREVRADGVVTPEESERLVRMMDALLAQDS